jgi:hypothetical protein
LVAGKKDDRSRPPIQQHVRTHPEADAEMIFTPEELAMKGREWQRVLEARIAGIPEWLPQRLTEPMSESERDELIGLVDEWLFDYDEEEARPRAVKAAKTEPAHVFDDAKYRASVEACQNNRPQIEDEEIDNVILRKIAREVVAGKITLDAAKAKVDKVITTRVNGFLHLKIQENEFAEKRDGQRSFRAMQMLLADYTMSDSVIAHEVNLTRQTVAQLRRAMEKAERILAWRPRGGKVET